jgi:hypothetical protein
VVTNVEEKIMSDITNENTPAAEGARGFTNLPPDTRLVDAHALWTAERLHEVKMHLSKDHDTDLDAALDTATPIEVVAPLTDDTTETEGDEAISSEALFDALTLPAVPAPPKGEGKGSRKRPCAKNNNRRREKLEGAEDGESSRPRSRKLNQYYLDVTTGRAVAIRPGTDVPKGVRVIEQLPGNPAPTVAQFFDATLLPAGSTIIAHYGFSTLELDAMLVARLGRLSADAGLGRQARKTNLDVIGRATDPDLALRAAIVALGGPEALDCDFKDLRLLDGVDRDAVTASIAASVNAGNDNATNFAEPLPARLVPAKRLVDNLKDLPGRVVSLTANGTGSRIEVRCFSHDDMKKIADSLRNAGGRRVDVKTHRDADDSGKSRKFFLISGEFACSPAELAAARTGSDAELTYAVDDSGRVVARYQIRLFDEIISSPDIPAAPTRDAVLALVRDVSVQMVDLDLMLYQVAGMSAGSADPFGPLLDFVGPVTNRAAVEAAVEGVTLDDILGEGAEARWESRPRNVLVGSTEREVSVMYHDGNAVLLEEAYHLADRRILEMPDTVEGPSGTVPAIMREVVFSAGRDGKRPKVTITDVPVAELKRRRAEFLARKGPEEGLVIEVRENVVGDIARSMGLALAEGRPDGSAKSRARNKHVEHVLADGGALVTLVATLAADPALGEAGEVWSKWCAQNVARYRNQRAKARAEGRADEAPGFFDIFGQGSRAMTLATVEAAAQSFLAYRFGRDVSIDEVHAFAEKVRTSVDGAVFTGFDRGRAAYQTEYRGTSLF